MGNPPLPPRAPMKTVMAALVNAINRQGLYMREQNMQLQAVEESRITRASTSRYLRRGSLFSPPRRWDHSLSRTKSLRPRDHRSNYRSPSPRR
ncbi:hypothetical protein A2U01_0059953, partial [Trifolium medium]|nr:hypothetical protein [Trifolium medium]